MIQYILLALVLSLAANAAQLWTYMGQRDQATKALASATAQRDQARGDASACSDATEALQELAAKRAREAAPARVAAATAARDHQVKADYTLSLQPRSPLDLCGSMQALGDEWLQGRAKP
jgi:peptidoglycan hydrolase CwlO-like protein